jgi:hypothetical protein
MAVSVTQPCFRVRTDATAAQGGTPVWAAAQNTNVTVSAGVPLRIRIVLYNSGSTNATSVKYTLWVSTNGMTDVAMPIADVSFADATNGVSPDGQTLTTSLLTSSGTFTGLGKYCPNGVAASAIAIPAAQYVEFEWGLQFNSPYCDGNRYTFYVYISSGATIDHYALVPILTLPPGVSSSLAATEADDVLAGVGKVPTTAQLNAQEVADTLTSGSAFVRTPAALAATEAADALAGLAFISDKATLAITEANDALAGLAFLPDTAALAATEAADAITGSAFQVPVGGINSSLAITENNDALTGVGAVTGIGGSLNAIEANDALTGVGVGAFYLGLNATEANDILTGFAGLPLRAILNVIEADDVLVGGTLLSANQWVPVPPCDGAWVPAPACQ